MQQYIILSSEWEQSKLATVEEATVTIKKILYVRCVMALVPPKHSVQGIAHLTDSWLPYNVTIWLIIIAFRWNVYWMQML